jgi:DinB superfamily
MEMDWPDDIKALDAGLEAQEREAERLVAGLTEADGAWRPAADAWSVAECLDHLATANRVYLTAMRQPAIGARVGWRMRKRPALPGFFGGMFARSLEPPPGRMSKVRAPGKIKPRTAPPLSDASAAFMASLRDARAFLREFAEIDLAGVTFPNPFITVLRFSLATGLHVIVAHNKRHLWQAWRVLEKSGRVPAPAPVPDERRSA